MAARFPTSNTAMAIVRKNRERGDNMADIAKDTPPLGDEPLQTISIEPEDHRRNKIAAKKKLSKTCSGCVPKISKKTNSISVSIVPSAPVLRPHPPASDS